MGGTVLRATTLATPSRNVGCSPEPVYTRTASWSVGGCSSGNSLQARKVISAGRANVSTSAPGVILSVASTWNITRSLCPAGTIRAATNFESPSSFLSLKPARYPSIEVNAQTETGSGCPGSGRHVSSTRSQPSHAQHVVCCSSTSRSLRMSSSVHGSLRSQAGPQGQVDLLAELQRVAPTRPFAPMQGSPKVPSLLLGVKGIRLMSPSSSGVTKPFASIVAAFPTRCRPYKLWLSRKPAPMIAQLSGPRPL
mmetsp:Transcript_110197/g.310787  ORF Transcript_110197/g.310787 Transcript_110197/m.310787 type:complete len:252 (+) Transcript_110197:1325-2080(+)